MQTSGYKLGLPINEFNKVGIDGRLIEDRRLKMVEIDNVSIVCACLRQALYGR